MQAYANIKQDIVRAGQRLYARNLLAAGDGNISYRVTDAEILITPSSMAKGFLRTEDIASITLDGKSNYGIPSSEKLMHMTVYQHCPKAKCVIHAHPPTAIGWSIAHPELTELPAHCMSELILTAKRIPFVPYARPGSQDMGTQLIPFLPTSRVLILSRHGALAWGETVDEAINGLERIEHTAQILLAAHQLGGLNPLPPEEVAVLYQMREKMGETIF